MYYPLCKIGTGFTDEFLESSTKRLLEKTVTVKPMEYVVHRTLKPDIWLSAGAEVWEVECDSLSLSPIYPINKSDATNKGISLRFPRFLRVRNDKNISDSTTSQ